MIDRSDTLQALWQECFGDDPAWVAFFFGHVLPTMPDAVALRRDDADGHPRAMLLLLPYNMEGMHNTRCWYLCGACTRSDSRRQGLMRSLLAEAVALAHADGRDIVLIPATEALGGYYARQAQFCSVFLVRPNRYTSLHRFAVDTSYEMYEGVDLYERIAMLQRLEQRVPRVTHTERQWQSVIDDILLTPASTHILAVRTPGGDEAYAAARYDADGVTVTDLCYDSEEARLCALNALRQRWPQVEVVVHDYPAPSDNLLLQSTGMLRIADVPGTLRRVAAAHPSLHARIAVKDPLIPQNNVYAQVADGNVVLEPLHDGLPEGTMVVTVDELAALLYNDPHSGDITGFPACRPAMALMFD